MNRDSETDQSQERRFPLVKIDAPVAAKLLRQLSCFSQIQLFELLAGGHVNTNYLVQFDSGRRVVLRIYAQGEEAFRKEIKVFGVVEDTVAVPELLLAVFEPSLFEHPFTVMEWVDGMSLSHALSSNPNEASEIGSVVATTLAQIGSHELPDYRARSLVESVEDYLFVRGGVRFLGNETADRLLNLFAHYGSLLASANEKERLVHGDFQGDNILLERKAGQWRVSAILDWEWAEHGCYLRDIGSLLRYPRYASELFQSGLEAGFLQVNEALPPDWRMAARIIDTAANCEKLACGRHRGEVTNRSIEIIRACLDDYA